MTNEEKFAKEIIEISCNGKSFAVDKNTNEVLPCGDIFCKDCAFKAKTCSLEKRKEWAKAKYKEPITVERLDKEFNKLCGGTHCGSCKYSDINNCNFAWLLEHYNVTEKGASE